MIVVEAPSVELTGVSKAFGEFEAVRDLSLTVAPGSICGLLAPSGGDKSTTLCMIISVYAPTKGTVRVLGGDPVSFTPEQRRRLGYMPQQFVLYPELSVRSNLKFMAGIYGLPPLGRGKLIDSLVDMVALSEARNRRAGSTARDAGAPPRCLLWRTLRAD